MHPPLCSLLVLRPSTQPMVQPRREEPLPLYRPPPEFRPAGGSGADRREGRKGGERERRVGGALRAPLEVGEAGGEGKGKKEAEEERGERREGLGEPLPLWLLAVVPPPA